MANGNEEEKENKASPLESILGGLLGLGSIVGGMVPSLRKGPQQETLARYQGGQGAGASAARQTGSEAARRVLGASTARPGQGRSGSLNQGVRAADELVQRGAQQAGIIGAREGLTATEIANNNELARRKAFRDLGVAGGAGISTTVAGLVAARDQQPKPTAQEMDNVSRTGYPNEFTPASQTFQPQGAGTVPAPGQEVVQRPPQQGAPTPTPTNLQEPTIQPPQAKGPMGDAGTLTKPAGAPEPLQEPMQQPSVGTTYGPAQEARQKVEEAIQIGAQKENDKRLIQATASPMSDMNMTMDVSPPAMTDPYLVQDWLYNQADNYDPRIGQGLPPEEVARLLTLYGFPVDWGRLGIMDISGGFAPSGGSGVPSGR